MTWSETRLEQMKRQIEEDWHPTNRRSTDRFNSAERIVKIILITLVVIDVAYHSYIWWIK